MTNLLVNLAAVYIYVKSDCGNQTGAFGSVDALQVRRRQ